MEIHAVFETWHLGDGNYPALKRGLAVNLSFEVQAADLQWAPAWTPVRLTSEVDGECTFAGEIVRRYDADGIPLIVIDTGEFRFYVHSKQADWARVGQKIKGRGTLVLDHYIWVEFLDRYADPPDLFYSLRVARIWKVKGDAEAVEVDEIEDDDFAHFVVLFCDADLPVTPVRRTFIS